MSSSSGKNASRKREQGARIIPEGEIAENELKESDQTVTGRIYYRGKHFCRSRLLRKKIKTKTKNKQTKKVMSKRRKVDAWATFHIENGISASENSIFFLKTKAATFEALEITCGQNMEEFVFSFNGFR